MVVGRLQENDFSTLEVLLSQAGLPVSGIRAIQNEFVVAREGEKVIAAGAIERHGPDGLLRSLVVDPEFRGKGMGILIVETLLSSVDSDLYLLTETAASFFERFGFELVPRSEAPDDLRKSEEFRCLCPESASFMRRRVLR